MTTTLTQASQQWISRPADQRFLSLVEMQAFKSRIRDNSATKIISSRSLQLQPSGESAHALQIIGPNGEPAASTHWSFGQLCSLASPGNSPASYFRETRMPAPVIADCLNFNLRFTRGIEDIGVLLTRDDEINELRSVNGPNYGRVYDADVVDALVDKFGDGVSGQWRVPGEFGNKVTVTRANTTLFASDRDMFVFLADEDNRIEIPNRRAGKFGSFARGFFVWNSEVGKTTARRRLLPLRLCLLQPHCLGRRPIHRNPHPPHQGRPGSVARRGHTRPRRIQPGECQAGG